MTSLLSLILLACKATNPGFFETAPSSPSFRKTADELNDQISRMKPCCEGFKDILYFKIPKRDHAQYYLVDENNQLFEIGGGKSFIIALELPVRQGLHYLFYTSYKVFSNVYHGGYFAPSVALLDENYSVISEHHDSHFTADEDKFFWSTGIKDVIPLPSNAKYAVVFTTQQKLSQSTAFVWDGHRTWDPVDIRASELMKPGIYYSPKPGNLFVYQNMPVGHVWIKVITEAEWAAH